MKANQSVSVIIPTYNRAKQLDKCLASLFKYKYPYMEVIVVDDSNNDETVKVLKRYPQVKIIRNFKRGSQAKAKNQGVASSSGKYVLFLDDDVVLKRRGSI